MWLRSVQNLFVLALLWPLVLAQNETRRCGLPENMSNLPDFAQDELRAVWKNYVPGSKCEKELLVTDDIVAVLNMFDKAMTSSTPLFLPTTVEMELLGPELTPTPPATAAATATAEGGASTDTQSVTLPTIATSDAVADRTFTGVTRTATTAKTATDKEYDYLESKTTKTRPAESAPDIEDDYDNNKNERVPLFEMQSRLPFLEGANNRVMRAFHKLVNDEDIPSEDLRQELIHLLAVSYLDSFQLNQYSSWSNQLRKRLRAARDPKPKLSPEARVALNRLIATSEAEQLSAAKRLPASIRRELREFAQRRKAAVRV